MEKKKGTSKKVIKKEEVAGLLTPDEFNYNANYEKLGISKIINSWFNSIDGVLDAINIFIERYPDGHDMFEERFKSVIFSIDYKELCNQVEDYLLKDPNELSIKILSTIISNKIRNIKISIDEVESSFQCYNGFKSARLSYKPLDYVNINLISWNLLSSEIVENVELDIQEVVESYGTLESLFNKTIALFKEGESSLLSIIPAIADSYGTENNYKKEIWFKVGLLFATGEIDRLFTQHSSPKKIAEHLKSINFEKYILATHNDYRETNKDKNIYANPEKLLKIYNHCIENKIPIIEGFIKRIPLK